MQDHPTLSIPLTTDERDTLQRYESYLKNHLPIFFEVGKILIEIRNKKLYREQYKTFELYCRERWQISRPRAYQLMDAADIKDELSNTCRQKSLPEPTNEAQTRALKQAPQEHRQKVWEAAITLSDGKQPSSSQVKQAIQATCPAPQTIHTVGQNMKVIDTKIVTPERTIRIGGYYETAQSGLCKVLNYNPDQQRYMCQNMQHGTLHILHHTEFRAECEEDYVLCACPSDNRLYFCIMFDANHNCEQLTEFVFRQELKGPQGQFGPDPFLDEVALYRSLASKGGKIITNRKD